MHLRTILVLSLPVLLFACAPRRVAGVQADPTVDASPSAVPGRAPAPARIDFETQVRPLLQEKCSPCHFPGGRMYDRLPFDNEGTIRTLGSQLFTRLKDPVDVELLRTFLEQPKDGKGAPAGP